MNRITLLTILGLLQGVLLLAQHIEFDTISTLFYSNEKDFVLNSSGTLFINKSLHSDDAGNTWKTPPWGKPKTGEEGFSYYEEKGAIILKYNIVDYSVDTIPLFDSPEHGARVEILTDGSGNTFVSSNRKEIYIFPKGGNEWIPLQSFHTDSEIKNLVAFENCDFLFFKYDGKVFKCNKLNGTGLTEIERLPVACHLNQNLINVEASNIFYSQDSGETWNKLQSPTSSNMFISHIEWLESGKILALIETEGFFSTEDLGQNWTHLQIPVPGAEITFWSTVKYDPNSRFYYLTSLSKLNTTLTRSSEAFNSFTPLYPILKNTSISEVSEDHDQTIYLKLNNYLKDKGYFQSTDNGETYQPVSINGNRNIRFLKSLKNNPGILAITTNDSLYRSVDSGNTWGQINLPLSVHSIDIGDNDEIIYTLSGETHLSTDLGKSWMTFPQKSSQPQIKPHPSGNFYQCVPGDIGSLGYIVQYTPPLLIPDTLSTFQGNIINSSYISEQGDIFLYTLTIDTTIPSFDKRWYVSYDNGQTLQLYHFSSNIRTDYTPNFLSFDNLLFDNTGKELLVSRDRGLTWYSFGLAVNGDAYISNLRNIYVSNDGVVYKSKQSLTNLNLIEGHIATDENHNCIIENGESSFSKMIVKISGQEESFVNSNSTGDFFAFLPDGDYEIALNYNPSLWEACDSLQNISISGGTDTTSLFFPVKKIKDCPLLEVDLTTPRLRRCFHNKSHVYYCNNGTIAADSAYVEINLDPRFQIDTASISYSKSGGGNYIFPIGNIDIFDCGSFWFSTSHDCDSVNLGETICATAHIYPDTICGDTSSLWSGASLNITGSCDGDSVRFKIKNNGTADMDQPRQYIIIEDVAIMRIGEPFQLPSGGELPLEPIFAEGQTFHVEAPQVDGHPGNSQPSSTVEGCGQPPHNFGLFNQFGQNDNNPSIDIECREVVGSYDPNDKSAVPVGLDVDHKIQPGKTIEYLVRFQNTGTDTAFTVNIIDTLSHWLEVTSFTPGASSHDYTYEISGQGTVRFRFNNIMLPDSSGNNIASNGFVKYKIAMKANIPVGAEILNDADIYFDYNDPVRTNETFHVIDEPWVLVKTHELHLPDTDVSVFPNPFSKTATLELHSEVYKGEFVCRIFDINGRFISSQVSNNQRITLSRKSMQAGIYFYKVTDKESGKIATGKLIVN